MTFEMKDECSYNLRTGKWIAGPGKVDLEDIENPINQFATSMTCAGAPKDELSIVVAEYVRIRGPIGTGKYACTCNNFGPRWMEDSADGCCPGCFQWALDHHYEVPTSKLDPNRVTMEMIENNTWGIDADKIRELNDRKHVHRVVNDHLAERAPKSSMIREMCLNEGIPFVDMDAGNDPADGMNINHDFLNWIPEDK